MASISDGADDILKSRVEDTVRLKNKRGVPCYLGFLDLHEQAVATRLLQGRVSAEQVCFFGGYPDAERQMLAVNADFYEASLAEFPLTAVAFRYRTQKQLSHRDVLGTLMSLGLRRDAIGDILCGVGLSVVFVRDEVAAFVCEQVDRIGGEGVTVMRDYDGELPICAEYEEIRDTIASARIDVLVKSLIRCSREQAAELIRVGSVSIDHMPVLSVSKTVAEGSVLSIRGFGRFYVDQIGPETKKGRLMLYARRRL